MNKIERILLLAKRNPNGLSFQDFEALLDGTGFRFDRQSGSHKIYIAPNRDRLSIQPENGSAKGY